MKKFASPIYRFFTMPFAKFILKKIFFFALTTFLAISLIWIIPRMIPGNPLLNPNLIQVPPGENSALIRERYANEFGLNKPIHEQYFLFLSNLSHFDLGTSISRPTAKVQDIIMAAIPWSLTLMIPAVLVGFFVGNYIIGARVAYSKGKKKDALYGGMVFISQMPHYWFAMILLVVFALSLGWFPVSGGYSQGLFPGWNLEFFLDALWHFVLPFTAVVVVSIGQWSLGMKAMMTHELDSDYVDYCRELGFSEKKVRGYASRNAILPQFTGLPIALGTAFGGSLITEIVFGYPGIGREIFSAISNLDFPIIQGVCIIVALVILVLNFLADLAYGYIDPRIRTGYAGGT